MPSLRLFPSFEKPVDRQRYLNVQPQRRGYGGIVAVLAFAGLCGFLLALPDRSLPPQAPAPSAKPVEKVAAVTADDSAKPTMLCNDKPTARRACADAKAAREARLAQALARADTAARRSSPADARARKVAVAASNANAEAAPAEGEQPAAIAPRQKPKVPRADDAPVERLVHVYDHVAPDGTRVPVYRRGNGGYEFGAVADGEYRQSRRAELGQPRSPSFFGLQ